MSRERRSREDYGRDREEDSPRHKEYGEDDYRRKKPFSHANSWKDRFTDNRKPSRRNLEGGRGPAGNRPPEGGGWHRGRHVRRQLPIDRPYENNNVFRKAEFYGSSDWIRGRGRREGGGRRGGYGRWMQRPFFHRGQEHASFHRPPASDDRSVKIAIGLPSNSEVSPERSKSLSGIQKARMIRLLESTYIPEDILEKDTWNQLLALVPENCELRGGSKRYDAIKSNCNRQLLQIQLNEQIEAHDEEAYSTYFAKYQIPRPVKRSSLSQQDCDGFIHDLEKELKKSDGEMLASGHVVMELQFGDLIANESLREIFQDLSSRLKHNGAREDENMDRQPKDLIAEPQELDNGRKTLLSSLKSSTAELPPASPSSEINDKTIPSTGDEDNQDDQGDRDNQGDQDNQGNQDHQGNDDDDEVVVDFDVLHGDDSSENEILMDE